MSDPIASRAASLPRQGERGDSGATTRGQPVSMASAWPAGHPRVLVTDAWLANAGDAALALATENLVREVVPGAAVLHAAYQGAELASNFPSLRFTASLEDLIGTPWAPPAPGWAESGPALVAGADAVISQGGGFLVEAYQPWGRIAALSKVARWGVPVAILGQTVGRFTRSRGNHLHRLMRTARLIVVRDPQSVANATALGATDVVLGTDLWLALFPDPPLKHSSKGVGLVLTNHHPDPEQRPRLADVAHRVAEATLDAFPGESVTLWSTVQGHPDLAGEDDSVVAESVVDRLEAAKRGRVAILRGYVPPDQAIALIAGSRAVVSMRMHPALFAAALDTPFCLVLGAQKAGVLEGTSLLGRVVDPGNATNVPEGVAKAVRRPGEGQWNALAPLRDRLDDVRTRLADFLQALDRP